MLRFEKIIIKFFLITTLPVALMHMLVSRDEGSQKGPVKSQLLAKEEANFRMTAVMNIKSPSETKPNQPLP